MLVLVVGPSGAGKDTLINAAREALAADDRFRFVRRVLTRPYTGGVERHEVLDEKRFVALAESGHFALHWRSNGVWFGIPAELEADHRAGRVVVANVSRAVLPEARRFAPRVIEITVPADVLARRLAALGRVDAVDAARRMARSLPIPPDFSSETVANDGTVEQGARRFMAALLRAAVAPEE